MLLALFLVISTAVYLLAGLFLPFSNEGQARRELFARSEELVSRLRLGSQDESNALFTKFLRETGAGLILLDENRQPVPRFLFGNNNEEIHVSDDIREYPFRFAGSSDEYILTVIFNPLISDEIKAAVLSSFPWVVAIILLISMAAAFFFSRYTTRPITRISATAARMANLDFSWYCPDVRGDEIGTLAKSVNELSDRLDAALRALKNDIELEKDRERRRLLFFSAVSHELKTPVATVIGQLEGMLAEVGAYKNREKYLSRSAEILRGLDGFIREILSVSFIDMNNKQQRDTACLSEIAMKAVVTHMPLIESRRLKATVEVEPDIFILGDGTLLEKAVGNAIANAAVHSPMNKAGSAYLTVRLKRIRNKAIFQVVNSNAHIGEEHLPHLFEAFYRAGREKSGGGSGLGLYITGMILENHNALFKIENCDGGVLFEAEFYTVS
ncbi:MAG: HAMP domain-containing histidine kinase [Clostridiales bacterium]|jgi:signal transduction histidine kinase|nr:HAMP domain-containing histidine kinase [Clostridiales bacterium]